MILLDSIRKVGLLRLLEITYVVWASIKRQTIDIWERSLQLDLN